MSYFLTILRPGGIPLPEFQALISSDERWSYYAEHSRAVFHEKGQDLYALDWIDGNIIHDIRDTEDLDGVTEIMIVMAEKLNGRLRDDDNNTYRTLNNTYIHADDRQVVATQTAFVKKAKRGKLIYKIMIIVAGCSLFLRIILSILNDGQ